MPGCSAGGSSTKRAAALAQERPRVAQLPIRAELQPERHRRRVRRASRASRAARSDRARSCGVRYSLAERRSARRATTASSEMRKPEVVRVERAPHASTSFTNKPSGPSLDDLERPRQQHAVDVVASPAAFAVPPSPALMSSPRCPRGAHLVVLGAPRQRRLLAQNDRGPIGSACCVPSQPICSMP